MEWTLASKRLPEREGWFIVKNTAEGTKTFWFNGKYFLWQNKELSLFQECAWLDESNTIEGEANLLLSIKNHAEEIERLREENAHLKRVIDGRKDWIG